MGGIAMPLERPPLAYPGVYVQEVSPGAVPIQGQPTAITAFLGRTDRGPMQQATSVRSFDDFARIFGEVQRSHPVSCAVRDFFRAGGAHAVVVRLGWGTQAALRLGDALTLRAHDEGTWGNRLTVTVDYAGLADLSPEQVPAGCVAGDLFNLRVRLLDGAGGVTLSEDHLRVTLKPGTERSLDRVLGGSTLLSPDHEASASERPADGTQATGAGGGECPRLTPADYLTHVAGHGFQALDAVDVVNLICVPTDTVVGFVGQDVCVRAAEYAQKRGALALIDPPSTWDGALAAGRLDAIDPSELGLVGELARHVAVYVPRIRVSDGGEGGEPRPSLVSGMMAGIFSRIDAERGVWTAPAGLSATLPTGVELTCRLTDEQSAALNRLGINPLCSFPGTGPVVWGARTLAGADGLDDDYRYVPVRRLADHIEQSVRSGIGWATFEPNAEPLWDELCHQIGGFLSDLFRQGAFQGSTASAAFFVRCDVSTTTQADIDVGVVNMIVGFAPLKPGEFVLLHLQQIAGANP
ncbi:MAG: phage tail sheath family protein [Myxococcales bacterium]|nr:phage tail sheath family protein [Myxococcales bacterium]